MRVFRPGLSDSAAPETGHATPAEQLFRDHNAELLRFLWFRLRNEAEAKEIAQEAYVRLLQLRDTGTISFLRAYLFKIAANLATDRLRERRVPTEDWSSSAENVPDAANPERAVLDEEERRVFLQCVDELPVKCRQAFTLHRHGKLSTQEVAQRLGITPRMVRKHISRAVIYCRYRLDGMTAAEAMERLSHD